MSESKEIALIEEITEDRWPEVYKAGGLAPFVAHVRENVAGEVPDLTTEKGRKRIASLAAKVSRSKTAVDKPGRDYLRKLKEMPKEVEAELRQFIKDMDALRDEVRAPLNEFEAKEEARLQRHRDQIEVIRAYVDDFHSDNMNSAKYQAVLDDLNSIVIDESYEEFEAMANREREKAAEFLTGRIEEARKAEDQQRELEELRRKQEEQRRKDEIAAAEKRAEERARQQAREEAEAAQRAAEAKERAAKEEAERKEREHKAAIERAAREHQEAIERAEKEKAEAIEAERQRIAAEKRAEEEERQRREKNREHKKRINNESMSDLVSVGVSEAQAKAIITAIAKGSVRNISINY